MMMAPGMNSGRFVIAVTAVGANVGVDVNEDGDIADVVVRPAAADNANTTVDEDLSGRL